MKVGQAHVADMSALSFLVIDEADRMVQQGHYQVGRRNCWVYWGGEAFV